MSSENAPVIKFKIVARKATRVNNTRIVPAGHALCVGVVHHLDEIAHLRRCTGNAWRVVIDEESEEQFKKDITAPAVPQPSTPPAPALSDDERDAAIEDLSEIDGIGKKTAEALTEHFNIHSRHVLHAVLGQEASFNTLADSDLIKASADDLAKWLKQLDAEEAANHHVESFYFAEKHNEDGTVLGPAIYTDAEGVECTDIELAQAFENEADCIDFIATRELGALFQPVMHQFVDIKDDDDDDEQGAE